MKLRGEVELHVKGEPVLRSPSVLDKLSRAFGGEPDLRTSSVRASLEAAVIVEAARAALKRLGAGNAVSLVVDDLVLFRDREGRADDLGDLFLAFNASAPVFGRDFSMLRLAVEHEEAGLHLVLEMQARSVHPADEPAVRVVVSGRVKAFEPLPGEGEEAYRRRVEPLTRDAGLLEVHRRQFEAFVSRVAEAMRAALPESRVEVRAAEAQVQRPARAAAPAAPAPPASPRYDPYETYYPNPFGGLLTALMWGSLFTMALPPQVTVIDERGEALGGPEALEAGYGQEAEGPDGGLDGGDMDGGFDGGDFDSGGDFGGWD